MKILKAIRRIAFGWMPSSGKLNTEVSACLPVIETLEAQILDAAKKGTNATDQLSASFGDMASRARSVVSQATGSDDSNTSVDEIRSVLSELLTQIKSTSQKTQEMAEMMASIGNDLQDVESSIEQIDQIANQSRMVSMNGQIEAARAMEFGDGFAVVASETGDLAQNVSATSRKIREAVDRMGGSLRQSCELTTKLVEADQAALSSCEERVEAMLMRLASYQTELESNLANTKSSSDELTRAISQAIVTLQFQDAVSQRLHHVTETMAEVREAFKACVGDEPSSSAQARQQEWIQKLEASYCVDDERLVLNGASAADMEQSHSSNVELF